MANKISKETYRALKCFALAVKAVSDLLESPSVDECGRYLAREYLKEMEDMLKEQLVTVVRTHGMRERILCSAELDYLAEDVSILAHELKTED